MPEEFNNMQSQKLPMGGENPSANGGFNGDQQQNINNLISDQTYRGSMQQILSENTGRQIVVDFLVGNSNIVRKEGILYMVGLSYIVLYEPRTDAYTVCNLYSVEFVTFLPAGNNNQAARTTLKRV